MILCFSFLTNHSASRHGTTKAPPPWRTLVFGWPNTLCHGESATKQPVRARGQPSVSSSCFKSYQSDLTGWDSQATAVIGPSGRWGAWKLHALRRMFPSQPGRSGNRSCTRAWGWDARINDPCRSLRSTMVWLFKCCFMAFNNSMSHRKSCAEKPLTVSKNKQTKY